jgi:hypothetical protein
MFNIHNVHTAAYHTVHYCTYHFVRYSTILRVPAVGLPPVPPSYYQVVVASCNPLFGKSPSNTRSVEHHVRAAILGYSTAGTV